MEPIQKVRIFVLVVAVLPMIVIACRKFIKTRKEMPLLECIGSVLGFCMAWLFFVGTFSFVLGGCIFGVRFTGGVVDPEQTWYRGV